MLPDLLVLVALVFVELCALAQLQIALQIAQRRREVVQVIGEQAAIAQLVDRRRIDARAAAR